MLGEAAPGALGEHICNPALLCGGWKGSEGLVINNYLGFPVCFSNSLGPHQQQLKLWLSSCSPRVPRAQDNSSCLLLTPNTVYHFTLLLFIEISFFFFLLSVIYLLCFLIKIACFKKEMGLGGDGRVWHHLGFEVGSDALVASCPAAAEDGLSILSVVLGFPCFPGN